MLDALRIRDFRRLFAATAVSLLGDGLFYIALAFAVQEVTGSRSQLGLVLAAGTLPLVGFILVGGVFADRLPRRRQMIWADLARVAIQGVLAVLLLTDSASFVMLLVLNALYGTASAFFSPAMTGLVPQVVDGARLGPANALISTARNAMQFVGAAAAGLLVDLAGSGLAIGIDALSFLVSAALLALLHPYPAAGGEPQSFVGDLRAGFDEVIRHPWLWKTILNVSLFLMLYVAPFEVVGPVVSKTEYGGATTWGLLGSAFGLGGLLGGLTAPRLPFRRPIVVAGVLFLVSNLAPTLLALSAPIPVIVAIYTIEGFAVGLFVVIWETEMQRRVPADKLSRVSAWDWMGSLAGMPLGLALAGFVIDAVGTDATLYGMTIVGTLLSVWWLSSKDIREIGARSVAETESRTTAT